MLRTVAYVSLGLSFGAAWFGHHSLFWIVPAAALCGVSVITDLFASTCPSGLEADLFYRFATGLDDVREPGMATV
jgi:hypothetical protein